MKRFLSLLLALALLAALFPAGAARATDTEEVFYEQLDGLYVDGGFGAPEADRKSASRSIPAGLVEYLTEQYLALSDSIPLEAYCLTVSDLRTAVNYTLNHNPDLFFVSNAYYYSTAFGSGYISNLYPMYRYEPEELPAIIADYRSRVDAVLAKINPDWTRLQKISYVHDYLCQNYAYDETYSIYSPYEMLLDGHGVCQAYMELFAIFMQYLDIPVNPVDSDAMNHTWNQVQLEDGNWYHIDVTWDDPLYDRLGSAYHTYFLCSDEDFLSLRHHDWVTEQECKVSFQPDADWRESNTAACSASGSYELPSNQVLYCAIPYWDSYFDHGCDLYQWNSDNEAVLLETITDCYHLSLWDYYGYVLYNDDSAVYLRDIRNNITKKVYTLSSDYMLYGIRLVGNQVEMAYGYSVYEADRRGFFTLPAVPTGKIDVVSMPNFAGSCTNPEAISLSGLVFDAEFSDGHSERLTDADISGSQLSPDMKTLYIWVGGMVCELSIDASLHSVVIDDAVAPTCTEDGKTEGCHCSTCGEVLVAQETIPALGHDWSDWDIDYDMIPYPLMSRECNRCGEVESDYYFAPITLKHTDCFEDGAIFVIYSNAEGKAIDGGISGDGLTLTDATVDGDTLNTTARALSLIASYDRANDAFLLLDPTTGGVLTSAAHGHGLTLDNSKGELSLWRLIGVEGGFHIVNVGATINGIHDVVLEAVDGVVTTSAEKDTVSCLFNLYRDGDDAPFHQHDFSEWTVASVPTCVEAGQETRTCYCGTVETREIAALGHIEIVDEAVEVTCTEDGKTEGKHCARCEEVLVPQVIIPALGHAWDEGIVTVEPTEETEGLKLFTCSRCDATRTVTIPVLGHEHSYEAIVTAPTCTEDGYTTHVCVCGETYVDAVVPALGHSWDEGTVTVTPTYLGAGLCRYQCLVCGEGCDEVLDVLALPYTDVAATSYYYTPVAWAADNNITNGTSDTTFSPDKTCTRGQIVTFLWRAMGCPEPTTADHPFTDVAEDDFFYKAVLWAVENGITNGTSATAFSPYAPCTRAQIVTFLWRAAGEVEPENTDHPFTDVEEGEFYRNAVLWAVENGITNGTSPTVFSPYSPCTRGQVVTFLYRHLG